MNLLVKKYFGIVLAVQLFVMLGQAQTAAKLGDLPLWFTAGQGESPVFMAHGRDSEISILPDGVQFVLRQSAQQTTAARLEFVGANPRAAISGRAEMTGKINYLIGNDATRWQLGLATFGQVQAAQVYPGVNVVYYGNQKRLEYDFDLAPGVKPEVIAIRFAGADKVAVNDRGELIVRLAGREIIQHQPVAYQISGSVRHEIQAGYKMVDNHTVSFSVGHYDAHLPLVIDPVLSYSTFFGGNGVDIAWAIALDSQTNIYIAGQTLSTVGANGASFATTNVAFQKTFQGGSQTGDAFIAKFDSLGTNLLYCTYLGGSSDDAAYALAVDGSGHAYVAGATESPDFPHSDSIPSGSTISGTIVSGLNIYPTDAFVSELETNGSSLIYSTYLGGSSSEAAYGIALDASGDAFVTGFTYSTNFPVTAGAFQTNCGFAYTKYYLYANAFISEIASGGNVLKYSSYLGGTNFDNGYAIAVTNGYVTVVGSAASTNFPVTNYINQVVFNTNLLATTNIFLGCYLNGSTNPTAGLASDAFVASFTVSGTTLVPRYVTMLGGSYTDTAFGVAVNGSGDAYVVGASTSPNFPNTTNGVNLTSYARTNAFNLTNAFLTKIVWNGTNAVINYSQLFGGYGYDAAQAVALDAAGNVFIVGSTTTASNVCATTNNLFGSLKALNTGSYDLFITAFKADLSTLLYSADLGGVNADLPGGIAVDAGGNAYITGQTYSVPGFPVYNARQATPAGNLDAFLAKIWLSPPSLPVLTASRSGTNVLVSWPPVPSTQLDTNSLSLVTTTNLLTPALNWLVVPQAPVLTNGVYLYKLPNTNQVRFFRLQGF
ncbi:MAG TPA: SBBP repeat-containing protein [Verrucomicrobiae bacterium]|jgi:hypothetical protein